MISNKKKRIKTTILHIIPDERFGGPQQRTLQVAKCLKEDDFISIIAMPKGDKTFTNLLDDSGILHYQIKNFKKLPNLSNSLSVLSWLFHFIPSIFSLRSLIKRNKINIVHANGAMSLQVPLAAKIGGAKLIWHLNDINTPKRLKNLLFPFLHFLPDKVVVSAKAVKSYYFGEESAHTNDVTILYPPVDTNKFHPNYNAEEYRIEFGLKESDKVVGIVGNINPAKGYEYFFHATKLIKESFPQVKFLIVGKRLETQEKYWQKLQSLITNLRIEKDVILAGLRTDIPQIMNIMDIFVTSSTSESFSMVTAEAMACAKPVVATRVGGVPELVIEGKTGILVPPKDPEAIAEAVLYLLNHPREAKEMGLKGRKRAIEYFDLEICTQRHKELYESLNGGLY